MHHHACRTSPCEGTCGVVEPPPSELCPALGSRPSLPVHPACTVFTPNSHWHTPPSAASAPLSRGSRPYLCPLNQTPAGAGKAPLKQSTHLAWEEAGEWRSTVSCMTRVRGSAKTPQFAWHGRMAEPRCQLFTSRSSLMDCSVKRLD